MNQGWGSLRRAVDSRGGGGTGCCRRIGVVSVLGGVEVGGAERDLVFAPFTVDAEGVGNVHVEGVEEEGAVLAVLQLQKMSPAPQCNDSRIIAKKNIPEGILLARRTIFLEGYEFSCHIDLRFET